MKKILIWLGIILIVIVLFPKKYSAVGGIQGYHPTHWKCLGYSLEYGDKNYPNYPTASEVRITDALYIKYCIGVPYSSFKKTQIENLPKETSNWKTYQSEEYGFEFEYPNDWKMMDLSYIKGFPSQGIESRRWILVQIESPSRYDMPGYQNKAVNYRISVSNADNPTEFRFISDFGTDQPAQSWWNTNISKEVKENTEEYKIGNQIISTFKFTK